MASDRILIVRIYGIGGFTNLADELTLTSRSGLAYLPNTTINDVVASMTEQFSSDIPVFGSLGSDPTTSFSLITTPELLSICLGRSSSYLRNSSNNAVVRTTSYITPQASVSIYCDDTTNLYEGDIVRISGSTFYVDGIASAVRFVATRIWGSPNIPIGMQDQGAGQVVGSPIAGVRLSGNEYSRGGIEQLPIVISTAPTSATSTADEEVIFRGMVSRVSTDTSMKGSNQIRVDCSSLMGMVRNTPFRPPAMSIFFLQTQSNAVGQIQQINRGGNATLQANYRADIAGPLWDWLGEGDFYSRIAVVQARKDKTGGLYRISSIADQGNGVDYTLQASSETEHVGVGVEVSLEIPVFFNDGVYATNIGDNLSVTLEPGQGSGTPPWGNFLNGYNNSGNAIVDWYAEPAFVAENVRFAIIDLLFGTFNANTTGAEGVRPVGMSAWLPFDWASIPDIVDLGELEQVFSEDIAQALPILTSEYHPWPYQHASARTVGDVLDWVFKRTGVFMVYDRGKFRFNRWDSAGVWPTEIDDTGLAEPAITLNFDRNNSVQTCEVDYALSVRDKDITREKYRVSNADALLTASGKTISTGNFVVPYGTSTELANSQAMRTAVNLVTRYSKAAALVEVTYRDAVFDLEVGEFVSFSSDYIPSAQGTMGVRAATGYVLKAERSWQTPTTKYTLWLYGYLTAVSRISLISSTGRSRYQVDEFTQKIDTNIYSSPTPRPGAPASDAASFAQTLSRCPKGKIPLQLLDEYGTPKGYTSVLKQVDVANDLLIFDDAGFDGATRPGDIFVIADAATVDAFDADIMPAIWDAFQADAAGQVLGKDDYSNPWMV